MCVLCSAEAMWISTPCHGARAVSVLRRAATAPSLRRWVPVATILAVALVAAALLMWLVARSSLPSLNVTLPVPGLQRPVTVTYDAWQRPYVQAQSLGDALHVQGWLHAANRLWQMELMRRAGAGRLAELLGAAMLDTDREIWRMGVPQLARRLEQHTSAETLQLIDRYLLGVNQSVSSLSLLPPEFLLLRAQAPQWTRSDVFAVGALMALQSSNNMENELLRLALASVLDADQLAAFLTEGEQRPDYPFVLPDAALVAGVLQAADRLAALDPAHNRLMPRLGFGSNGWVVAGNHSATGNALFAFDSHDELGLPNLFYEVHLFIGDEAQLRGWSVAGMPGVINGYNERIAWGFTNIGDTQDLFVEQRSKSDPMLFRDGTEWRRARRESVLIPVRDAPAQTLEILHTHNGPLISEEPPISLAWTVHRLPRPNLDSLLALNRAGDWPTFSAALDSFPAPTLNVTYADVAGTIAFRSAGILPKRAVGQGLLPADGSDPAQQWLGLVDPQQMPRSINPQVGFLAAANARVNAPGQGVLVSGDNAAPYRIARISQFLKGRDGLTSDDMQQLQFDRVDGQAQLLLPTMLAETAAAALTPDARLARDLLVKWRDAPVALPDSAAALIFQQWYMELASIVFADTLQALWPRLLRRSYVLNNALDQLILSEQDSPWWRGDRPALISAALERTVVTLAAQFGPDPSAWQLDDALRVHVAHELGSALPYVGRLLNLPETPWAGGPSTVGRARYSYARPYSVNAGATVRTVAEMSTPPKVQAVMPGGQSGHFLSDAYSDQFASWLKGALLPIADTAGQAGMPGQRFLPQAVEP